MEIKIPGKYHIKNVKLFQTVCWQRKLGINKVAFRFGKKIGFDAIPRLLKRSS